MSKNYLHQLQDKSSYIHIFAALIEKPYLLNDFPITEKDFPERFHRIVFSVINNLIDDGAQTISSLTIDSALKNTPTQHKMFTDNSGIEYVEACVERGETSNFAYHYTRMKKFTLLRQYYLRGVDVSDLYSTEYMDSETEIQQHKNFNAMTVRQMINHVESKFIDVKDEFVFEKDGYGGHISDNIETILEQAMTKPDFGAPFQSGFYNTATRGARRRKLYCVSGNTGSGKTRSGEANLLYQCTPIIYDPNKECWIFTGNRERGLMISTELEEDEVKIPALCYIACVSENDLRNNEITDAERARLRVAAKILAKMHFWIEELFDFDVDDLDHLVNKYVNRHDVGYVFFDYIHTTLKMFDSMAKRGAKNLQEHQILRILSVHLKNMCNKLNIWMGTSTQLNAKYKEEGNLDETAIEGSKSVANKFDLGAIQIELTAKDQLLWEELKVNLDTPMGLEPTHTINIYKNRGNRWKFIRIWVHFDMGTLRVTDLFVTNYKGQVIDMKGKQFIYTTEEQENYMMDNEQVLEIIKSISEDSSNEEYKDTEFDATVDKDMQAELNETYEEMEIEEDPLPEVFADGYEENKGTSFGENKGKIDVGDYEW